MLRDYFGDAANGRLSTRQFLSRWALLLIAFLAFGFGIGALIGVTERIVGGNLEEAQRTIVEAVGGPAAIAFLILIIAFVFADLNITAKRARDVGLPGWLTALVIAGLSGSATKATGEPSAGGVGFLLTLILAFLPTNWLGRRNQSP